MQDATRKRFGKTADRIAALQDARAAELEAKVVRFLDPGGDERALDSGSGAGALAFALAPHVREVVAVDLVPELLEQGRKRAEPFPNVSFVEGNATALPFEPASFDLAGSLRTLHHIARPELAVAELARVTRPGGRVLVIDQIASVDPVAAAELNAFERARDPSHARALADIDLRHLFESNELVLLRNEYTLEPRELGPYLDLAGCEGEARERAEALAPASYTAELGWYLLEKRYGFHLTVQPTAGVSLTAGS
jgi:ubiquinone/menaquinone biosynthesis C-methylase UbiE